MFQTSVLSDTQSDSMQNTLMAPVNEYQSESLAWLTAIKVVTVSFNIGSKPIKITIHDESGFIRVVDRNAISFEVIQNCPLHQMMSNPHRHHAITLLCQPSLTSKKSFG